MAPESQRGDGFASRDRNGGSERDSQWVTDTVPERWHLGGGEAGALTVASAHSHSPVCLHKAFSRALQPRCHLLAEMYGRGRLALSCGGRAREKAAGAEAQE